jgi:hypothetical protein
MAARPETIATTSDVEQPNGIAAPKKISTILRLLLLGRTLSRFDAESLPDHCLHSTIAHTKISTILSLFLEGTTLNRFDAEIHHDHCLHSTVASLQEWGLIVDREWERVPCLGGRSTVRCKRYWLRQTPDNVTAARVLLKVWRRA